MFKHEKTIGFYCSVEQSSHHDYHPFITSLRKELRENLLESIFVDQAARAFLLETPVYQLDLLSRKSGGSREGREFLRLMSATKSERGAPGAS